MSRTKDRDRRQLEAKLIADAYQAYNGTDDGPRTVEHDTPLGRVRLVWMGCCYYARWLDRATNLKTRQ